MSDAQQTGAITSVTTHDFYLSLQSRMTDYNARLLLETALTTSGLKSDQQVPLSVDQAKALCLQLIRQGGPAFHVGQAMYKRVLQ